MKRNGYTIAEAVITMAIVGIVAALTIPTFVSSYRKTTYANSLSAAVSNFNTAMTTMIMKEGVNDLLDTRAWLAVESDGVYTLKADSSEEIIEDFYNNIKNTLALSNYETFEKTTYKALSDPANDIIEADDLIHFTTKNGVIYMLSVDDVRKSLAMNEVDTLASGGNYHNRAAFVHIDVNGTNPPNIQGRDWFRFELGTDGHLYPYGGRDHTIYDNDVEYDPTEKCVNDRDGSFCAAYLIENRYKMDY